MPSNIPRVTLTHAPTPLEPMNNLSELLGTQLYIKRDDCTGLAMGGNKTRKLEYLVGAALEAGADTLVTVGGIQSNHARQTAAAAAKFGLACELILEDVPGTPKGDYYHNGNLLLDQLCGAVLHHIGEGADLYEQAKVRVNELSREGKRPYLIPLGGSNEVGSLGYMRCADEIIDQASAMGISFDQIVVASGSGGTQAGLLAGLIARDVDIPVLGVCVSRSTEAQHELVDELLQRTLRSVSMNAEEAAGKVFTDGGFVGEGYGIPTSGTIEAVRLAAQHEAILLDPVYTGKGMAGLIELCRTGVYTAEQKILFIHTGGAPGLFAYTESFL